MIHGISKFHEVKAKGTVHKIISAPLAILAYVSFTASIIACLYLATLRKLNNREDQRINGLA
ncbi:hypothetical protein BDQ12DRAFT_262698 [Crucibulum laeve]|uniref:Uncharacterized protein n=1 Tax=Crucibulum laeve TaxID=68775 RepID=A0A5C3LSU6_9AGAR|nr:hypothetical protein BDQ12DRAFT_262698 [Crucibulum laeve]